MKIKQDILNAQILIVDDQAANILLLKKILQKAGYQNIHSTMDARQATRLYVEHNIDLLLLDIRMPYLDGFKVMDELKNTLGEDYLPILVLTAELTSETKNKALNSGAKDFLTKPFDSLEILLRVNNIIEVRLLHKKIIKQNQELEEKVKARTKALEQSQIEIIQRLGLAAEYKDNETGNHVLRMSKASQLLAQAAGLSDVEVDMIISAAPMHDIGKIGIPDSILLKPGKLNATEWTVMKKHVEIGGKILSGSDAPLMVMARQIAMTHHEKWDGTGYPQGLSGEAIPIAGRICAICDVFDALTSERPYKQAWSIEDAMAFLKEQRGRHFDPDLVLIFEKILEQVLIFRSEHLDQLEQGDASVIA